MSNTILASDLDGTFIPLKGNEQNRRDLVELTLLLQQHSIELVYVTGRHHEIVLDVIESEGLPRPNWLICDVGTTIYRRCNKYDYELLDPYVSHLSRLGELTDSWLHSLAQREGIQLQEQAKQGRFKKSFYCEGHRAAELATSIDRSLRAEKLTYHVVSSVDPFTGDGLIDLLPDGVNKAYALAWWVDYRQEHRDGILFAGDSGNDLAALIAGYRAILVGNADRELARQVAKHHHSAGWQDRLFLASHPATSGVLQGVLHYVESARN
jgi:HAD superfamily hydrolase (TIGR01484 family)